MADASERVSDREIETERASTNNDEEQSADLSTGASTADGFAESLAFADVALLRTPSADHHAHRVARRDNLREGRPFPLGASWDGLGVNFAIFSAHATKVELCLFDESGTHEVERIE